MLALAGPQHFPPFFVELASTLVEYGQKCVSIGVAKFFLGHGHDLKLSLVSFIISFIVSCSSTWVLGPSCFSSPSGSTSRVGSFVLSPLVVMFILPKNFLKFFGGFCWMSRKIRPKICLVRFGQFSGDLQNRRILGVSSVQVSHTTS